MMAGGTGGHVFPALAVASALRERGHEVSWIGTAKGLEARVVPDNGFALDVVQVRGLRSSGLARLLAAPLVVTRAMWQAAGILRRRRPDLVVGMGGFATGPGGVVARLLGLPLVVHEQNAVPGLTNRILSRLATRVLCAFPGTFAGRAVVTGNPVRPEIASLPAPEDRFGQRGGLPLRILVMGGSLGAAALNELVPQAIARLAGEARPEVRHQAGRGKADAARAAYDRAAVSAEVSEFIDDVAEALAWADLVICRAGALTISELAAAGVGAVLVPYPYAVDDHQTANAGVLNQAGAAVVMQQQDLTPASLADWLTARDRPALLEMARQARACALPEATQRVAAICEEVMA
jgi:UDP-N-acetylglucosamine--N-acetylmuramyl-(pentapeptide) pyrophosphoryl-undecaprenol N-acetylglucosamine transferase